MKVNRRWLALGAAPSGACGRARGLDHEWRRLEKTRDATPQARSRSGWTRPANRSWMPTSSRTRT